MKMHIDIEIVNQILGYLGTRPYQEVFQLVQAIQDAAKPPEMPEAPKADDGINGD